MGILKIDPPAGDELSRIKANLQYSIDNIQLFEKP